MQIDTQNIQRPSLFSDFFTEEIDYKNDFVSYIDTSSNDRNIVHKGSVTSLQNNSETPLKKYRRFIDNELTKKQCPLLSNPYEDEFLFVHGKSPECILFVERELKPFKEYYKIHKSFNILDFRSHISLQTA